MVAGAFLNDEMTHYQKDRLTLNDYHLETELQKWTESEREIGKTVIIAGKLTLFS